MMPWFGAAPLKLKPMTENIDQHVRIRREDLLGPARDRAGVLQRRSRRRLHLREEVALVLFGQERPRDLDGHPVGQADQQQEDHDQRPARAQPGFRNPTYRWCPPVMPRSKSAHTRFLPWCSRSSSSAASAGVSVTALNADSATAKPDRHRELRVEPAGRAREERDRDEHRDQHQRRRDDRAEHFAHRVRPRPCAPRRGTPGCAARCSR